MKLSFITPVAYDWKYALHAIRSYYDIADEVIIGVDKDRLSWSGKPFKLPASFFSTIAKGAKVRIIEQSFYSPGLPPMENETHERNALSMCATGGWVISIDSDEILVNPKEFREWLEILPPAARQYQLTARLMTIFKTFPDDIALLPVPPYEAALVGTTLKNQYRWARMTDQERIQSPLSLLHYGWGRTRREISQKLRHWGHSDEPAMKWFMKFWDGVTLENHKAFKNFHPLRPELWSTLEARQGVKALT